MTTDKLIKIKALDTKLYQIFYVYVADSGILRAPNVAELNKQHGSFKWRDVIGS